MKLAVGPPPQTLVARLYEWRAAIVAAIIITGVVYGLVIARPMWRAADIAGARELTGTALVLDRYAVSLKYGTRYYVSLRVGQTVTTTESFAPEKWEGIEKGDRVTVSYRVGKSGSLYVDDWTPPTRRHAME